MIKCIKIETSKKIPHRRNRPKSNQKMVEAETKSNQ